MKTGLLVIATVPLPELAMVRLPTLMRSGPNQPALPGRLRQRQSSPLVRSGQCETPLLMKTGLLTIATLPAPESEPEPAMVRLPALTWLGRNQTPSWLRLCQNHSPWPNLFGQCQNPLPIKTELLTTARLPVLVRFEPKNQRPARLRSRCTNQSSPRLPCQATFRTPTP